MPAPFYLAIKGATTAAPGLLGFTPSGATADARPWSSAPVGWMGLVRYDDGAAWEYRYGYWNGTIITRASGVVASSAAGAALTLTINATATMVTDPNEVQPHFSGALTRGWFSVTASSGVGLLGVPVLSSVIGTAVAPNILTTSLLTEQSRQQYTTATTSINVQVGWASSTPMVVHSTAAGRGGWEFASRFGYVSGPANPRAFIGMANGSFVANTGEPSAAVASYAVIGKDAADTNFQFLCNNGTGAGTKIDTGIVPTAANVYGAKIWSDPGGGATVFCLLMNYTTGAIYYGSTTVDVPANNSLLMPHCLMSIGTTAGTNVVFSPMSMTVRGGV